MQYRRVVSLNSKDHRFEPSGQLSQKLKKQVLGKRKRGDLPRNESLGLTQQNGSHRDVGVFNDDQQDEIHLFRRVHPEKLAMWAYVHVHPAITVEGQEVLYFYKHISCYPGLLHSVTCEGR